MSTPLFWAVAGRRYTAIETSNYRYGSKNDWGRVLEMPEEEAERDGYDALEVADLEMIWGEGFLSPGGPSDLAKILEGVDLSGRDVLDFGCGIGGYDILLAKEHGARSVLGVDVQRSLLERAAELTATAGLSDRVSYRLIEPGPLPFEDTSFDVVFSKGAIFHIDNKAALFGEILRVLRPAGLFLGEDLLKGGGDLSEDLKQFIELSGQNFYLATLTSTKEMLERAGFCRVELRDRDEWYRAQARRELQQMEGPEREERLRVFGEEWYAEEVAFWRQRLKVLDKGELRAVHIRAVKG